MIRSLGHVALGVADMERSLAFYRDLLGMELIMELDVDDERIGRVIGVGGAKCRIVHLKLGDGVLELFQYREPVGRDAAREVRQFDRGLTHIGFEVDDFHRHVEELKGRNVEFLGEPVEFRPGVWVVYFRGPDGEVCEFRQQDGRPDLKEGDESMMEQIRSAPISDADVVFLLEITRDVIECSRIRPGETVSGYKPNTSGGVLIRPGGRECYPAFWIRDYAMSLDSGLIPLDEQKHALLYTVQHQQEGDWRTPSGSLVPHGAIPDHITFDGRSIFFPGTIDGYEVQGGKWGKLPSLDDHYYFIHMARHYTRAARDPSILDAEVNGKRLIERLALAFDVPRSRADSHLVWCDESNRGVSFGFVDGVFHTGELLFCSLLKFRAACQMAGMYRALGEDEEAARYEDVARTIRERIPDVFASDTGLLKASTGTSGQPDVWGSAFAVYADALEAADARKIGETFVEAYKAGTLAHRGSIRHVLTCHDYDENSVWERTVSDFGKNRYQNGAYWSTPTGWVCFAMAQVDEAAALKLAGEFIDELREGDFRKGARYGSPWECFHPEGDFRQNPVYMTSVTGPLAAFRRLGWL